MIPKLHPYHYRVILILFGTVLYFFANLQRVAIPGSIFNTLQQELQITAPYVTALGAAFMYVYAWNQLVIGVLIERYGGAQVIAVGALLFCLGALMFPLSHSLFWLYFSRCLTGLGASSIYLSLVKEIKRASNDKNFSLALSVMLLAGYTGGIMANAPFAAGAAVIGWRSLLIIVAVVSILFYALFLGTGFMVKLPPVRNDVKFSFKPFINVMKNRHNLIICLFACLNFGQFYVIQTVIGKKFLEDFCRMEPSLAGWFLSLTAVLSACSGLFLAVVCRFLGHRRRILMQGIGVVNVVVFLLILVDLIFDIRTSSIAALFCVIALTSTTATLTVPLVHETNPAKLAGTTVCFVNFGSYIMVAMLGNGVGILMNICAPEILPDGLMLYGRGSYAAVFVMLFIISCISAASTWRIRETHGKSIVDEMHLPFNERAT